MDPSSAIVPVDFQAVFQAAPGLRWVVAVDAPRFTIVAVSDAYLKAMGVAREDLVGRGVDAGAPAQAAELQASLARVLASGVPDTMPVHKTAAPRSMAQGGGVGERYWLPRNLPVRDAGGRVTHVIHEIDEVTERIQFQRRKQAQDSVADGEQRFGKLFEQGPLGMLITGLDHRFEKVNRTFCRMLGYGEAELVGRSFNDITHPADLPVSIRAADALEGARVPFSQFKKRYLRKDGGVVWAKVTASLIADEAGQPQYFLTTVEDLSESQRFADRMRESETRYRRLIETAEEGVWTLDAAGRTTFVNPKMGKILGFLPGEMVGKHLFEFMDDQGRQVAGPQLRRRQRGIDDHLEFRFCHRGGAEVWVLIATSSIFDEDGRYAGVLGMVTDITDRKRMEGQLRESRDRLALALDAGQAGLAHWDTRTHLCSWNPRFSQLLGYEPGACVANYQTWRDRIHPADLDRVEAELDQARGERRDTFAEYRLLWPTGEVRWVRSIGRFAFDAQGAAASNTGIMIDITALKEVEAQMRAAKELAEAANRAKDEFLALLSHELRTPAAAILIWANLLQTGLNDEPQRRAAVETIIQSAKIQVELVNDLLDTSGILLQKVQIERRPMNLAQIVRSAAATIRPSLEAKGIQLHLDLVEALLSGDACHLSRAVSNLLANALKFTPKGGHVTVRLERRQAEARLEVSDDGEGITAAFVPRLFERFTQADSSSTRRHGGLGLGLSIVKSIVELHGGSVTASSGGAGLGSTFALTLPLAAVSGEHAGGAPGAIAGEPWGALRSLVGVRILAVEDDEPTRESLAALLGSCGAHGRTAASVAEAGPIERRWKPHVLLSDLAMPDADGFELIQRVRKLKPRSAGPLLAVALTASAGEPDRARALASGFDLFLAKPVEPRELIRVIAQALKSRRAKTRARARMT